MANESNQLFDLEKILMQNQKPIGPYLPTEPGAEGPQLIPVPENKKEEKLLKKGIAPMPDSTMQRQKALVSSIQPIPSETRDETSFGFDREKLRKLIDEQTLAAQQMGQYEQDLASTGKNVWQNINWKPIAAYLDTMTGGKLAESMPTPMTPEERATTLAKLQAMQADARKEAARTQLGLVQAALERRGQNIQAQDVRFQKRMEKSAIGEVSSDIEKNYLKPIATYEQGIGTLERALNTGDYDTIKALAPVFSRQVAQDKGALSEQDVNRAIPQSFERLMSDIGAYAGSQEKIPERMERAMRNAIASSKISMKESLEKSMTTKQQMYQASPYHSFLFEPGGTGQVGFSSVKERLSGLSKETTPQAMGQDLQKAALEELKRRQGNK